MTDENRPPLRHVALGDLDHELGTTRKALERIPRDRIDWRPHERSWTILELGTHITRLVGWMTGMLERDEYDMAETPDAGDPPEDVGGLLSAYDGNVARLEEALGAADDRTLSAPWTLRDGEEEVLTIPRMAAIRSVGISHMVHHRGQLTVYLRLLDEPVPALYGPSADEEFRAARREETP